MQWDERIGRRLKPRDLHIFMAVAEHGNMAKAAARLAISRPVVSRTIADLERTLGVRLLDRNSQGVEPTLYGRALLRRSTAIFDELRQSVKEIEFLADPAAGELRIGCTETIAAGLLSAVIDRISRKHPRLMFQTELGDADVLQSRSLRERRCEVVIARLLQPAPEPDMAVEALFHEQLRVVAGPGSKWHGRRKLTLADLVDEPWILSTYEVVAGEPAFEAFRAIGLDVPRTRILSNSLNLRNSLLATGRMLTLVPGSVLRFGPRTLSFTALPVGVLRWRLPVAVITLKNRTLSPAAELFIQCARDIAKPLAQRR